MSNLRETAISIYRDICEIPPKERDQPAWTIMPSDEPFVAMIAAALTAAYEDGVDAVRGMVTAERARIVARLREAIDYTLIHRLGARQRIEIFMPGSLAPELLRRSEEALHAITRVADEIARGEAEHQSERAGRRQSAAFLTASGGSPLVGPAPSTRAQRADAPVAAIAARGKGEG